MKVRIGIAIAGALLLPVILLAQSVTRDWDKNTTSRPSRRSR